MVLIWAIPPIICDQYLCYEYCNEQFLHLSAYFMNLFYFDLASVGIGLLCASLQKFKKKHLFRERNTYVSYLW